MNTYRLYTKAVEIIKNVIVDVAIINIITGKFNSRICHNFLILWMVFVNFQLHKCNNSSNKIRKYIISYYETYDIQKVTQ